MWLEVEKGRSIGIDGAVRPSHQRVPESLDPGKVEQWFAVRITQGMVDSTGMGIAMDHDNLAGKAHRFDLEFVDKFPKSAVGEALGKNLEAWIGLK